MADCIQSVSKKKAKLKRVSLCVGCGSQIHDQYILRVAPDLEWHASCLKCADCSVFLDETCTCFVREGKTYCKRDYVRLFGTKCAKCSNGFSKNDFVMRAKNKIYHIDCFRCVACSRQLIPGDEFALRDDGLFCKADHSVVERAVVQSGTGCDVAMDATDSDENKNTTLNNNNNNNDSKLGIKAHANPDSISCSTDSSSSSPKGSGGSGGGSHRSSRKDSERKTTRVRTVLNEKQLHTLRTCYGANPRPDALMKEQLTEMTGLSARVIRVWFQNKRCKDKKRSIAMKQMQQQHQEKGVPMVASSPVRHEPNIPQPNPVEVQSYQAPWKALSEFAMQSDLDQAPFQQLVNSFDHHDGCEPHPGDMGTPLPHHPHHHHHSGLPYGLGVGILHDDQLVHPPNSVSSDNTMPGTPSEMSSPLSQ